MSCCSGNTSAAVNDAYNAAAETLNDNCTTVFYTPQQNRECITPTTACAETCDCQPIPEVPLCAREYRLCTDQCGCAARYPADCRNRFWPNFSHPRWLPCSCLYCTTNCCTKNNTCHNRKNCGYCK